MIRNVAVGTVKNLPTQDPQNGFRETRAKRLGWRLPVADHVFGGGGFGHTDAEHLQFTMDPTGTPTNVVPRHGPNQFTHIGINSWSATLVPARFPGPIQLKTLAMPTDGIGKLTSACQIE